MKSFRVYKLLACALSLLPLTANATQFGNIPRTQVIGAATKTDDTNVTLTLGGTPTDAFLNPVSFTLGWTGVLAEGRGGTGTGSLGDISKVNDTNVTLTLGGNPLGAVIKSTSFTLGWTGQLAVGRGGTGVSTLGDITKTNDTNVTLTLGGTPVGSVINSTSFTLGWTGTLSNARGGFGADISSTTANTWFGRNAGTAGAPAFNASSALTKTDDTNVTLTLGGTPTTALLNAASLTLGWTGTLAKTRGGFGADISTVAANTVFGNNTGSTAAPAFQSLVDAQVPDILTLTKITGQGNGIVQFTGGDGTISPISYFTDTGFHHLIYSASDTGSIDFEIENTSNGSSSSAGIILKGDTGTVSGISRNSSTSITTGGASNTYIHPGSIGSINLYGDAQTLASATSLKWDNILVGANTLTITGTTAITTATGLNKVAIYRPTYTDSSAATLTNAATVWIEDAPLRAGSLTITNLYSLWIDNGIARLDGGIVFSGTTPTSGKIAQSNGAIYTDSAITWPTAAGSAGNQVVSDGTGMISVAPASFQGSSASPTGTASTTGVMMGVSGTITPTFSGRILVSVTGNLKNGTIADGASMHIRTGTGTKPANGAALTGTVVGGAPQLQNTPSATFICPISDTVVVTGLAIGTAVWLDVDLAAITGGTATLQSVAISAMEF